MRGGFATEVRAEALRSLRHRVPLLLLLLCGAAAAWTPFTLLLGQELARIQGRGWLHLTGFGALIAGARVGMVLGGLSLALLAGSTLSGEASLGTMRTVLAGPTRRRDWFLAKAALLFGWATVVTAIVWGLAALSASALGFDDIRDPDYPAYVYLGAGSMWGYVGRVALISVLSLWTAAAVGMLISAFLDNPTYAVMVTVGVLLFSGPVLAGGDRPYLVFASLWEWFGHLGEIAVGAVAATAEIRLSPGNIVAPLAAAAAALTLGLLRFGRRDILI